MLLELAGELMLARNMRRLNAQTLLEALEFVRRIYDHFGNDSFSWQEILALLPRYPEWSEINRHVEQKVVV